MSVLLFFGYSLLVLMAGFTLSAVSIYHIYKKSRDAKRLEQETLNESAAVEKS